VYEPYLGIIILLAVVTLGLLITRIATVALMHTGLSRDLARFQSRSAFTGCGFTTGEAELIVGHPVRRRIVMLLMLLGNGTVVMAISSLIPIFMAGDDGGSSLFLRIGMLLAGLAALWAVSSSKWVDRNLSRLIGWALRRFTRLEVQDYVSLLNLSSGFSVKEMVVKPDDWVAGKDLTTLRLADEGINVLAIHRADGGFIGTPTGRTFIRRGDRLILYARAEDIRELDERPAGPEGDAAHEQRAARQSARIAKQKRQEAREPREEPAEGAQVE
jgi:hypothetical protein